MANIKASTRSLSSLLEIVSQYNFKQHNNKVTAIYEEYEDRIPYGILVPNLNGDLIVFLNGDDGGMADNLAYEFEVAGIDVITISFRCLSRFLFDGKEYTSGDQLCEKIAKYIRVVDFSQDERIKGNKSKRPAPGFVHVGNGVWHRSATVLFEFGDQLDIANGAIEPMYIIMGVDENQYFGSLLKPDIDISNIADAYLAFMPKHIREVSDSEMYRQGEWYFIRLTDNPMDFEGAEKFTCSNTECDDKIYTVLRSRNETEESNNHVVISNKHYLVDDTFGINGGKKINIFGGDYITTVYHDQHEPLELETNFGKTFWWAIENTAIKSYSEEGVD